MNEAIERQLEVSYWEEDDTAGAIMERCIHHTACVWQARNQALNARGDHGVPVFGDEDYEAMDPREKRRLAERVINCDFCPNAFEGWS